ncbi:MAG: F0F1 ATP synthase subunit B [Leptospirales bacterium]|nr:F0F1 ATP synthase subunit B [Leptospirales bacterium]
MTLEFLAGEGGIALLDVNPGLVIWTFLIFGLVLLILWKFAWSPIASALDERARRIHSDIDRAEQLRVDAESKLQEYMEKLNGLRAEGQEILAEARKDAEHVKQQILSEARKDAEDVKSRALREVQLARDAALESIHQTVATLSMEVAAQILERTVQAPDHDKLVKESVARIKALN